MIQTDYKMNGHELSYEIAEDGYDIYLDGRAWITQHEPYIPYPKLSYEEGCLEHIKDICKPAEEQKTMEEKMNEMKQYIGKLEKELSVQSDAIATMSESIYSE